jgi:hypothetical protein
MRIEHERQHACHVHADLRHCWTILKGNADILLCTAIAVGQYGMALGRVSNYQMWAIAFAG